MEDSKDTRFEHDIATQRHGIRRQKSMALFFRGRGSIKNLCKFEQFLLQNFFSLCSEKIYLKISVIFFH